MKSSSHRTWNWISSSGSRGSPRLAFAATAESVSLWSKAALQREWSVTVDSVFPASEATPARFVWTAK